MTKNNFVFVVSSILLVLGIMHSLRLFYGWEAQIGNFTLPMWFSWIAVPLALYLSFSGFKSTKKA